MNSKNCRRYAPYILILALAGLLLAACAPAAMTEAPAEEPAAEVEVTREVEAIEEAEAPQETHAPTATAQPAATQPPPSPPPEATATPEVGAGGGGETPAPAPTTTPTPAPLEPTTAPTEQPSVVPTQPPPAEPEPRLVEYEWPTRMRLGESDLIRLALIPYEEGYVAVAEFEDHTTEITPVEIERPPGYDLYAAARLDAVGFEFSPGAEQVKEVPVGKEVTWRWNIKPQSAGRQRVQLSLTLRWTPQDPNSGLVQRETAVWSQGLTVRVTSILGLSIQQARSVGVTSVVLAGIFSVPWFGLTLRERRQRRQAERAARTPGHIPAPAEPNPDLVIQTPHNTALDPNEVALLQSAFHNYARLSIEAEFVSGYSGARTFLTLPTRPDGHHDAHAILKIGPRDAIVREYRNYESYVKRTLPPITARIQEPPVVLDGPTAAMRYTFVGAPHRAPHSLHDVALTRPATQVAALIETLFDTFGPNWWLQHHTHTVSAATEYDRLLPSHLFLEPASGPARAFDAQQDALESVQPGDVVTLRGIETRQLRADGQSWALRAPGTDCPLRARFRGPDPGPTPTGRVAATRHSFLAETISSLLPDYDPTATTLPRGFCPAQRLLPNPLHYYPRLLQENLPMRHSIIHGDLNLENILVGPGELVWLIDFEKTRTGHALFDFVRLETELVAHLCAPVLRAANLAPADFLPVLDRLQLPITNYQLPITDLHPTLADLATLLASVRRLASRLLYDPAQPREHAIALFFAALGALKFPNLDHDQKRLLLLTVATQLSSLQMSA